jgi:hypothetical protein
MKTTCLVLGAGFSKSVANLPVTNEMFKAFEKEIENQRLLKNTIRIHRGERLFDFLRTIEDDFLRSFNERVDKGSKILKSNYLENFEGFCSFLDLNLAFEVHALSESNGVTADLTGKPLFANYTSTRLGEIRSYLGDYLYLTLINDKADEKLLDRICEVFFNKCSAIITFNYDLILEKYLYKNKRWFPKDGYGFIPIDFPKVNQAYLNHLSPIKILKMHGSLNWEPSSLYESNFRFKWFDDDNNYFFPGYLENEEKRNFRYQGAFSSDGWILPSWIKQFSYNEIIKVWNQAFKYLDMAEEVIFIGYSLPKADAAVYSLFSCIEWGNKIVKLFDPNAKELLKDYSFILRKKDLEIYPDYLENYLK